jgi:hypothetical protein
MTVQPENSSKQTAKVFHRQILQLIVDKHKAFRSSIMAAFTYRLTAFFLCLEFYGNSNIFSFWVLWELES